MKSTTRQHTTLAIFQILTAAVSFGIMATFVKWSCQTFPSFQVVFFRSLFGSIAIALMIWKEKASFIGSNPWILVWRGLSGFIALSMHFYAIQHLKLGTAVMLNYTAPIFVVILARVILKEKVSRAIGIAVLTSFVGLYFLAAPQFQATPFALAVGILSGIFAAISYVLIRFNPEGESPYTIVFYFSVISTIGSLPTLTFGFIWPDWAGWAGLAGVSAGAFFGQIYLTKAIQNAPVSVVMPFAYLTPVIASVTGMIFWEEFLSPSAIAGAMLIIASGVAIYLFRQKPPFIPLEK